MELDIPEAFRILQTVRAYGTNDEQKRLQRVERKDAGINRTTLKQIVSKALGMRVDTYASFLDLSRVAATCL